MAVQRGVFTSEQAYAAGHTQKEIQRLRRRHLLSIRRGVYAVRETYLSLTPSGRHAMRVAALALALSAPAVLSHQTAATELGLELLQPDLSMLHVTRPVRLGSRKEAGVDHHMAELPDHHVLHLGHVPMRVTTLARTAFDVARDTDRFECALASIDSALRMGVPLAEIEEVMDRCRAWRGARRACGAVSLADGRADNPGESWARAIFISEGVPPDEIQVSMYDADGLIGCVDFIWDGVVGEFDGKLKYRVPEGADPEAAARMVWKEKLREDRLRVDNEVVRWVYADYYHPRALAERVRRALARAAARRRRTA
jgi:hypothetical protein